ncbi:MAG: hypothetical protein HKN09_10090 [Saprospiraceae bacterium]|nr:hypothetical protein [Saprospiraceae bacterium]
MNSKLLIVIFGALINACILHAISSVNADDSSLFIYGKVTTIDNETYEGQIRWGGEEAFWFDMFNSSKEKNEYLKYLSDDQLDALNGHEDNHASNNWNKWFKSSKNSWSNWDNKHTHLFACQFGDIASLIIHGDEDVELVLKNGEALHLDGGSNDIGADVMVHDGEIGDVNIDWRRIKKVEFMNTPNGLVSGFGQALWGAVETEHGNFTGFLQWDHDERLTKDVLDGEYEDGELSIEFGKIKKIQKYGHGSKVTLHSGRSFNLYDSNDVDEDNRGIIVNIPGQGRVDIEWDEFVSMTIAEQADNYNYSYTSFTGDQALNATVETVEGKKYSGALVFDLDEKYQLEMLDGVKDDITYFIPFGHVAEISPLNREESEVILINGTKLILEEKVDVTRNNDGVLVFENAQNPQYIPWNQVRKVSFR